MENKREYINKMAAKLKELESEINELEQIADKAIAETKAKYQHQINDLFLKKEELKEKQTIIMESGENAWEDMKAGTKLSWEVFNNSVKQGKQKKGKHKPKPKSLDKITNR